MRSLACGIPLPRRARARGLRPCRVVLACAWLVGCTPGFALDKLPEEPPLGATGLDALLACAGPDQVRTRGLPASLDGRCSRQLGEAELRGRLWRQRAGERVTLDSAVDTQANLIAPTRAGALEFGLELRDDTLQSTDSTRLLVVDGPPLAAPVALASGDVQTPDGVATLDASRSAGVDAAIQAVRWSQLVGAAADLSSPTELRTDVTLAAEAGVAVFAVEVQDQSGLWSEPDFVVVQRAVAGGPAPVSPQLVAPPFVDPGALVVLAPALSWPAEPEWSDLRQLRGDLVQLNPQTDGVVQLRAPRRPQSLVFRLDQELAGHRLAPALAVVQVTAGIGNRAPVADAGPDRSVRPAHGVALNGSRSHDPDGTALQSYHWWQEQGVPVQLACHDAVCTFDAPRSSEALAFALVVSDGTAESAADVVVIAIDPEAANQPPVANAGGERWVLPGSEVVLDGRASDDPDSGRLESSQWEVLPPLTAEVTLAQPGDGTARFTAPATATTLHFRLTVCDVDQACSSDDATVHVEDAGPFVDPLRGVEQCDGTAGRPCRTLAEGLQIALRFGLGEVRVAAGEHVVAQPVDLPADLVLGGGWVWDGASYAADATARSVLSVAGVDGVTLGSGASLENLELRPLAGGAAVGRRRLVVMGPRTALRAVILAGPELADEAVTLDVGDGHRVEIVDSVVQGGIGASRSTAVLAGPASDLVLRDSQVVVGRAPVVTGILSSDGQLTLLRCALRGGEQVASAADVTGLDIVRSTALVEASALALDDAGWTEVALGVTLRCHMCQPTLRSQTQVRGPTRVRALGRGVGVSLFLPRDAEIQGQIVGGVASPGAELVALEAMGGDLNLQRVDLQATGDGQAASAVALALDSVALTSDDVDLHAVALERAVAAQLVGLAAPQLALRDVYAAAASAWGITDGWQSDLVAPADGSSQLALTHSGAMQVEASSEATGFALRGTQTASLQLQDLRVAAPPSSRGGVLVDTTGIALRLTQAQVQADAATGVAVGLECRGAPATPGALRLTRSVLRAQAARATGLAAQDCDAQLVASLVEGAGQLDAQAIRSSARTSINSCALRAPGSHSATVVLEAGATGELRNSILAIGSEAAGLEVSEGVDQWLALHHLLFEHQARPLLTVRGAVQAADDEALGALRSRFGSLRSTLDSSLDATGHLTSALSPAVDTADPATVSLEDIDGEPRPLGQGPDIGPDEAY